MGAAVPWAVQRYQALTFLGAFTWESWLQLVPVSNEYKREPGVPINVERGLAEWREWREGLIRRYRLEGLIADQG